MTDVMNGSEADKSVYTSPTVDTKTGEVYIKFVNSEAVDKELTINMGKGQKRKKYTATVDFISSHDTKIKNQGDQNTFAGAQPQAQQLPPEQAPLLPERAPLPEESPPEAPWAPLSFRRIRPSRCSPPIR